MSIKPVIQAKTEAILEREAISYGVTATALAKAIVETVVGEGIIHETLAGIDVEAFQQRRRGSDHGKGAYRFEGRMMSLPAISQITGIHFNLIKSRLARGWDLERAAMEPVNPAHRPRKP